MGLDANAVELLLDRAGAELVQGLVHVLGGVREHRLHRAADFEPVVGQRLRAPGEQGLGDGAEGAAEHHRAAYVRRVCPGGHGQGLGGEGVQGALADLAADQAAQEVLLVLGGGGHQPVEQPFALCLRALSGHRRDPVQGAVDVEDGEAGPVGGRDRVAERPPSDAGSALGQPPGEVGDHGRGLGR